MKKYNSMIPMGKNTAWTIATLSGLQDFMLVWQYQAISKDMGMFNKNKKSRSLIYKKTLYDK